MEFLFPGRPHASLPSMMHVTLPLIRPLPFDAPHHPFATDRDRSGNPCIRCSQGTKLFGSLAATDAGIWFNQIGKNRSNV